MLASAFADSSHTNAMFPKAEAMIQKTNAGFPKSITVFTNTRSILLVARFFAIYMLAAILSAPLFSNIPQLEASKKLIIENAR